MMKPKLSFRSFAGLLCAALLLLSGIYAVGRSHAGAVMPADINNDGRVDVLDLSILLGKWDAADAASDIDHNGVVNVFDLSELLSAWGHTSSPSPAPPTASPAPAASPILANLGTRIKTNGCAINGPLPDKACTPGAVFAVTASQVCIPGYSSSVRNVSQSTKNAVYAEYGIASHAPGEYEVDHLIPLELGGSNDISNLWPEPANPTPGFYQKDSLENNLHAKVCSGAMSLVEAQLQIADNWALIYKAAP